MRAYLPEHIGVVEMGALDGLSETVRKPLEPGEGDITLVSRLHNGRSVKVSEEAILPLLQEKIRTLEAAGTKATILACTGSFPPFDSRYPLLYPDRVLYHFISGVLPKGKLGIIVPLPEQIDQTRHKWKKSGLDLAVAAASPYDEEADFEKAAAVLKEENVDIIVLDCMGYSEEMRDRVKRIADSPVALSRSVVARAAAELV